MRRQASRSGVVVTSVGGVLLVMAAACSSGTTASDTGASSGSVAAGGSNSGSGSGSGSSGPSTPTGSAPKRPVTPTGPTPAVSGPVTGGATGKVNSGAAPGLLTKANYVEDELFLSGIATSYKPDGDWQQDGIWKATADQTAAYTDRAIVRRPSDPTKFNGTVFVEWLNVSGGADLAVDFGYLSHELTDQGYIYVGVGAQKVGSDNAQKSDPTRYTPLVHPGDQYSYDMFTQAGRAVLANKVFPTSYDVKKIIADGESQSAGRMTTYINAVQPTTDVYDAFLVHSRGDRGTPVAAGQTVPNGAHIRTDLRSPTLVVLTETDVLSNQQSLQDDNDKYRRWEIAGSAHVDNNDLSTLAGNDPSEINVVGQTCVKTTNTARQYLVMDAGLRHLNDWIGAGPPPPSGDKLIVQSGKYVPDERGNSTGGIRLPEVVAPYATYAGLGNTPSWCSLFGSTTNLDASIVTQLYPDQGAYVKAYSAALDQLVAKGFAIERDATDVKAQLPSTKLPA
jgi:hypothetical protein